MRHKVKGRKLGRTQSHRKATLSSLSVALIKEHRIVTTLAKAKELRTYVEPLITKAKEDTTHNRRQVFSKLNNKKAVTLLFDEVAQKAKDRPGGYTRVIKMGSRSGDGADMAVIELVDYNDIKPEDSTKKKRTRRAGKSNASDDDSAKKKSGAGQSKKKEKKAEAEAAAKKNDADDDKDAEASAEDKKKSDEE